MGVGFAILNLLSVVGQAITLSLFSLEFVLLFTTFGFGVYGLVGLRGRAFVTLYLLWLVGVFV